MAAMIPSRVTRSTNRLTWRAAFGATSVLALSFGALAVAVPEASAAAQKGTIPQYGVTFTLPSGWYEVSLSASNIGTMLGAARKVNASLHKTLTKDAVADAKKGEVFFGIGTKRDAGGSFPNVNVIVETGTATLSQLVTAASDGLKSIGAKSLSSKARQYGFGPAAVATYSVADSQVTTGKIYGTQIYAAHGSNVFITTFTSAQKSVESKAAAAMMSSWSFG
jgi:hypothetical protein